MLQWNLSNTDTVGPIKCREVSSFQGANNTYLYEVGIWSSVLIREVSFKKGSTVFPLHESIMFLMWATFRIVCSLEK